MRLHILHAVSLGLLCAGLVMHRANAYEPLDHVQVKPIDNATVQELRSSKSLYVVSCPSGLIMDYSWTDSTNARVQCLGSVEGVVVQSDGAYEQAEPISGVRHAGF